MRLLGQSTRAVGFTGAGISTECGIPDFRSPNSPWMRHKPIEFGRVPFRSARARRSVAAQVRHGRYLRRRAARARACRHVAPGEQRQDGRCHHAEYRRAASGGRHAVRQGDRAARQRHLRQMPELRGALRTRRRACPVRTHRRRAGMSHLWRPDQVGDDFVRPGDAGRGDAARRTRRRICAICFSPSAPLSSSIPLRPFRNSPSETARRS